MSEFYDKLQKICKEKGVNPKEICLKIVSQNTMRAWFFEDKEPKQERLIALAELLNCDVKELEFTRTPRKKPISMAQVQPKKDIIKPILKRVYLGEFINHNTCKKCEWYNNCYKCCDGYQLTKGAVRPTPHEEKGCLYFSAKKDENSSKKRWLKYVDMTIMTKRNKNK